MTQRAFTLIELLVVLAIIGVLVAITVPAMSGAVGVAHQTACASNLRQIGFATQMYLKDNDGWFFWLATDDSRAGRVWYFCGYDGGAGPSHNTAWIYRGELPTTVKPNQETRP